QHGTRANNIIQSMLAHSRGEPGQFSLTDINALVREHVKLAYHGMRAQMSGFNVQIETHFDPAIPNVEIVPEEIGRVVINLINNAFFATAAKQQQRKDYEPVIRVQTRNHLDDVEIRVRDNGIGIPEPDQEKVFTPFFTTKPSGQGTGLGLSLSYDVVVKEHGGTLDFESVAGEFAEFVVTLPKQRRPEVMSTLDA
ncbi:MAG: ATP-binding protein, partial [Candidatus Hydrogenedentales bacterium]